MLGSTSFQIWAKKRRIPFCSVIIILIYFLPLTTQAARGPGSHSQPGVDRECLAIGNLIKAKGFSYPWWNNRASSGGGGVLFSGATSSSNNNNSSSSGTCPVGKSGDKSTKCCRDLDSPTLKNEMTLHFNDKWLGPKLTANGDIFKDRKKKFDVTFKDLLTRAHAAFHAMFERTYGMLYIQHAPIFHALFSTLEAYYDNGRDSLEGKLNEFFAILTRKMFEVLNAQYEFDDTYLSCATIVITEKQGGDLHRQIVSSLRRSFVATRALAQGLNDADRVFTNLQKLKVGQDCISSLSTMLQCPICSEVRVYKPCTPLCTSVTAKCLSSTIPLAKSWTDFTNAMEAILDRLLGPYNVEAVVEPIHIKISEAIMNFQESGPDLSQAVFAKCGKPKLKSGKNYKKREASAAPENLQESSDMSPKRVSSGPGILQADGFRASNPHDDTQPHKSLEKLLREIKNRVKKSKSVWDALPRQVCNGISKDYSSKLCWNGSAVIRPETNKTSEEIDSRAHMNKGVPNLLVTEQILVLQLITDKLRASFNGLDVQWVQEAEELDFGGSGMEGSGSGESPTDLDDSGDDDPSGQIKPNLHQPPRPKFKINTPSPPFSNPLPNHEDEEDDDEDEDDNSSDNTVNWNSVSNSNNNPNNNNRVTIGGEGIDFVPSPPKVNYPPPPVITLDVTTTSTTTTKRPDIDVTKTKHPTASSGSIDEASKAIAFFKLFSPIFASLIGKAFSFQ